MGTIPILLADRSNIVIRKSDERPLYHTIKIFTGGPTTSLADNLKRLREKSAWSQFDVTILDHIIIKENAAERRV
jgi:hypothetical protein